MTSPAKLNFFLEVRGRRADGYHELETMMCRVSLRDHLTFSLPHGQSFGEENSSGNVADEIQLTTDWGRQAPPTTWPAPCDNLIVRTLRRLQMRAGVTHGLKIHLRKRIPLQAGMGGASSNAATALIAANQMWNLNWSRTQLESVANEMGSDISYFLHTGGAWCRGRGERIQQWRTGYGWPLVVIQPPFGLSTAEIFQRLTPAEEFRDANRFLRAWEQGSMGQVASLMFNRLETVACQLNDWFREVAQRVRRSGAYGGQMTGSGSCYFGMYRTASQAVWAARKLQHELPTCTLFHCRTVKQ